MSANALSGNASMLRTVALQIDLAVAKNKSLPDYLQSAAGDFTAAIQRYISEELEGKNGNNTESTK
jgi:hypothetical protein